MSTWTYPTIIGDRLNTSNKSIMAAVLNHDSKFIYDIAKRQVHHGAFALDIAASACGEDELCVAKWLCESAGYLDTVRCVDTHDPHVVFELTKSYGPLILNSFSLALTKPDDMLAAIRDAQPKMVIAVCIDHRGTKVSAKDRAEIAKRMVDQLSNVGIPLNRIVLDPVTMPASAGKKALQVTFKTAELIRRELKSVHGVLGVASNYSFGVENREQAELDYVRKAQHSGIQIFLLNSLRSSLRKLALKYN